METLLFLLIQFTIKAIFGAIQLALALAVLFGRVLAMLLPLVFRAAGSLITGCFRLLAASIRRGRSDRPQRGPWDGSPNRDKPIAPPRAGKPAPKAITYRRRYTVDNFWRSGDRS